MAKDEEAENHLYTALVVLAAAIEEVRRIPRPQEVARIKKNIEKYAEKTGIELKWD